VAGLVRKAQIIGDRTTTVAHGERLSFLAPHRNGLPCQTLKDFRKIRFLIPARLPLVVAVFAPQRQVISFKAFFQLLHVNGKADPLQRVWFPHDGLGQRDEIVMFFICASLRRVPSSGKVRQRAGIRVSPAAQLTRR